MTRSNNHTYDVKFTLINASIQSGGLGDNDVQIYIIKKSC